MRHRNPMVTGALAGAVLFALVAGAVIAPKLVFLARTNDYTAEFANAAGLTAHDQVYVAGVPSGRVTEVSLAGDRVHVRFRLDNDQPLGEASSASIKLLTILGTRYLSVQPAGSGKLDEDTIIPLERTSVPYSLDELAGAATGTVEQLDLAALQKMVHTMREVIPQDPGLVNNALTGVAAASDLIARRDKQFDQLLEATKTVTSDLLGQRDTLISLVGDATAVAQMLDSRRAVIRQLIADVGSLSAHLRKFLADNADVLGPLLNRLHELVTAMSANEKALSDTLTQLAPTSRYLANATGNGPWADVVGPAGPLPDNLLCVSGLVLGCR